MSDIVSKLLRCMDPYIKNIDEAELKLNNINEIVKDMEDLKNSLDDKAINILNYSNQELIYDLIKRMNGKLSDYDAYKYILNSGNEQISKLPQYEVGIKYINELYDYILMYYKYSKLELNKYTTIYQEEILMQKYYNMIENKNLIINDVDEFINIVNKFMFTAIEKKTLIISILKDSCKNYANNVDNHSKEIEYDNLKYERIIQKNMYLLTEEYLELLNTVGEIVDISQKIEDIVNDDLINKININNIVIAKKIWLMKKIVSNYKVKSFNRVEKLINEFEHNDSLLLKVKDNKNKKEAVKIIKGVE